MIFRWQTCDSFVSPTHIHVMGACNLVKGGVLPSTKSIAETGGNLNRRDYQLRLQARCCRSLVLLRPGFRFKMSSSWTGSLIRTTTWQVVLGTRGLGFVISNGCSVITFGISINWLADTSF